MEHPLRQIRKGLRATGFDFVRYYGDPTETYHQGHREEALRILGVIEGYRGKISGQTVKTCDEYARDVFGAETFAPWLYVYSALAGSFKPGWIPDNYYGSVVVPRCKGPYGKISYLKPLTNQLFHTDVFPDVLYIVNGRFFRADGALVRDKDVADTIFAGREAVVFKAESSSQGKGVVFHTRKDFDIEAIKKRGNGVIQSKIEQHEFFTPFAPNSTATLRITTVIDQHGAPSVRASYLRFGRIDDTHVRSRTHVRVSVDIATGQFAKTGYLSDWRETPCHPDTKAGFAGNVVPGFKACTDTVLKLHSRFPFAQSIGWDTIIDRNNSLKIMEWNGDHNDIKFSEATQGPCFSDLGWERLWRG